MNTLPRLYCAIDTADLEKASALAAVCAGFSVGIKLGMEFYYAQGLTGVMRLRDRFLDLSVFLDLKFHDIPNTVAGAVRSSLACAPDYLNVHASGGLAMMQAAQSALDDAAQTGGRATRLLAVTVFTSLDAPSLSAVGQGSDTEAQVVRLAKLTRQAGLAGVVCSPQEIGAIRAGLEHDFVLMVPGIRPASHGGDDQKRTMTPAQALLAGADHLVIGRPITAAPDPHGALEAILRHLDADVAAA